MIPLQTNTTKSGSSAYLSHMPHAQYAPISGYTIAPQGLLRVGGSHYGSICCSRSGLGHS